MTTENTIIMPIIIGTEINNGLLKTQNTMPQKDSTSDNQSSFSADRRSYYRTSTMNPKITVLNYPHLGMAGHRNPTVFDGTHSVNQKKWHSNRDASEVTRRNRVQGVGLGTFNSNGQAMSFESHANANIVNSALRRVRGGGAVAPPKKAHNIPIITGTVVSNIVPVINELIGINGTSFSYPYTYPVLASNYGNNWTNTSITAGIGFVVSSAGSGCGCSANGQYAAFIQSLVGIWVTNNFGVTWTLVSNTNSLSTLVVSSSGKYMYTINSTTIFYSTNYGISFTSIPFTNPGTPVVSFNEQYAFMISSNILYYSTNYGANFNTTTQFGTTNVIHTALSYTGAEQVVLSGTNVYISLNFGSTWTTYSSGFYALSRVRISADGKYILGYGSTTSTTYGLFVGKWNGSGYTFTTTNVATSSVRFSSISFTGQYMNIITFGSTFLYSNDYGVTWNAPTITTSYIIPTGIDFYAAAASLNGKYVITGWRGFNAIADVILESNDYGATYTQRTTIPVSDSSTFMTICVSADGNYQYATGTSPTKTNTPILSSG